MKARTILFVIALAVMCFSCNYVSKEKKEAAMDYHEKIFTYYSPVIDGINGLFGTTEQLINNSISDNIDSISIAKEYAQIGNLVRIVDIYTDSINKLEEFDKEINYKKIALENMADCKKILQNEYTDLIDKISFGITEANSIEISEIILDIYWKLILVQKKSQETQIAFANKYKFKLQGTLINFEQLEKQYHEHEKAIKNAKKAQNPDPVIE
ncbi:MAG TPA: hypothetical protein PKN32_13440 [Bacteroidales bacterium]|nr:hypothetical protein [Bacteroidales bacterium]